MLDGGASLDNQLADWDAGRTDGVAGAAIEAVIQMRFESRLLQVEPAVLDGAQEIQSTARGEGLERGLLVGGANGQAASAADAVSQRIVVR